MTTNSVSQLAVDATSLYWTDNNDVLKVGVGGGAVVTLVSGTQPTGYIAVDATNVYWTTADAVWKAPLAGGTLTTLAPGQNSPSGMTVDAKNVYWVNLDAAGTGSIVAVPISGGTPVTLAAGRNGPRSLVVVASQVVWVEGESVWAIGVTGGTPTSLASVTGFSDIASLAFNGTDIYFGAANGTDWGAIEKVAPSGGAPTSLVSNVPWPAFIAADGMGIYWSTLYSGGGHTNGGTIASAALDGSAVCNIASTGHGPPIAIDATSIYWADGNHLMKATPK
jgi:hypothetical protein